MAKRYVDRKRTGRKSFDYFNDGQPVTAKHELEYYKSIGVPPAWQDVKISVSPNARILATGVDKAKRLQYIYNPKFRARQEKEKFERILRFARALPKMRETTAKHLRHANLDREKVLAAIVQFMDRAYFRVGNEVYARENQSYGLTTIRSKHTKVRGDTIVFDFIGKSGQQQIKRIKDKKLARIVKQLDKLPGYEIFKYYDEQGDLRGVDSSDVNEYIKEVMGEEFSAKDFRTWGGTLLAAAELANAERARNVREREKVVTQCVVRVAARLGNTPAIARASYIDPRIINAYVDGDDLSSIRETVEHMDDKGALSADEHCVLKLLEKTA
jgi:DNA topoisomerase I